jgi:BlaI family penicillinase repressor
VNEVLEKISDSELEILNVLWDESRALPMSELRQMVSTRTGWESSTIKTLVQRLCSKGALKQEKRDVFYYSPSITRAEYGGYAARNLANRVYHGRASGLVAALVGTGLSREERDELRKLLEEDDHA